MQTTRADRRGIKSAVRKTPGGLCLIVPGSWIQRGFEEFLRPTDCVGTGQGRRAANLSTRGAKPAAVTDGHTPFTAGFCLAGLLISSLTHAKRWKTS